MPNRNSLFHGAAIAAVIPLLAAILLLRPDPATMAALSIATALAATIGGTIVGRTLRKTETPRAAMATDPHGHARTLLQPASRFVDELNARRDDTPYVDASKRALYAEINSLIQQLNWLDTERGHRYVTVLMSDLRGFTTISETYDADEVVDLLNRYFSHMSKIIYKYGGTIDKLIGDSIMAVFGIPASGTNHALDAACCAIEMQIAMSAFNKENLRLGLPALYMGIGINSGDVVASRLGSDLFSEYTVIGNAVNVTARIESSTVRGQILISHSTYEEIKEHVEVHELMEVFVKGRKSALRLYDLFKIKHPRELTVPEREIRRSQRAVVNIPFKFHVCEGKIIFSDEFRGRICNISTGGMQIITESEIEPYFFVRFSLDYNILGIEGSDIYGKILRVAKHEGGYMMNIEFTIIDPNDRNAIQELVNNTLSGLRQW